MPDDLARAEDHWCLTPDAQRQVEAKRRTSRLGFAVLLVFFRERGRFPRDAAEVDAQTIRMLSEQLDLPLPIDDEAFLRGRTAERLRAEIRSRFGFRETTVADADHLTGWLCDQVIAAVGTDIAPLIERLEARCRELAIEPPTVERMERTARSAVRAYDDRFHARTVERLSVATRKRLDALLRPEGSDDAAAEDEASQAPAVLLKLLGNPGRPSLASLQDELAKLDLLRGIELPQDLFDDAAPRDLERCRRRVSVEAPYELRRHPDAARLTWLAALVHRRVRTQTDDLVDLLIETIHTIGARAERKVERELLEDLKRVTGKQNLLFALAEAMLAEPDGVVRDVVFPVVGEQTLQDLVKEWKATGPTYRLTLRAVIRNSYRGHYRRMVPRLLAALDFRSNNDRHRPVMEALELVERFTEVLRSPTAYETLERSVLRPRVLLCLHGIGTAAGLQRMANLDSGTTAKDLTYVRRRYLNIEAMRRAIALIADGTLQARNPAIWGEGTTACASDSKHFGAWDQNLTTQWHVRYGGRGVMIYWHVERKSLCIHSQLKAPSSSEVASMIEGVLHHCTEMEVDRQYVDSHGQSTVAFAFCRLLGFELLPRLKAIHAQKLYRPEPGKADAYKNLQLILTRPIDWELIRQQYDQMIKYTTALRQGTAETEAILRRFTRQNVQHPTYKALAELGKAIKTLFLCRYLHSEALRREINEGLNVVEQWNGATDFVFFARRGEMVSNRREDHEISMLALHLIQNCMVYINTLMIQAMLAQPHWQGRLTPRDYAALTPLIWEHVNPYGRFELDMSTRLTLP